VCHSGGIFYRTWHKGTFFVCSAPYELFKILFRNYTSRTRKMRKNAFVFHRIRRNRVSWGKKREIGNVNFHRTVFAQGRGNTINIGLHRPYRYVKNKRRLFA